MIIIKGIHSGINFSPGPCKWITPEAVEVDPPTISLPVEVIAKHENTPPSFRLRADFDFSSVSRMSSAGLYDSRQR
jgi:hypothetical protein